MLVIPLLLLTFTSCSQKKFKDKDLFERYVVAPMPKSVKNLLINNSQGTIDANCSFIFEIAPNDFKKILKSKNYKKTDLFDLKLPKTFSELPDTEREIYFCKLDKKTQIFEMVTNKKHDKVYFLYINY